MAFSIYVICRFWYYWNSEPISLMFHAISLLSEILEKLQQNKGKNKTQKMAFVIPYNFRTQSNIEDGVFYENSLRLKAVIFAETSILVVLLRSECAWLVLASTQFSPVFHFYTPWKRQKTKNFLTRDIEIKHWDKMGWLLRL